jgi:hypothetical protein
VLAEYIATCAPTPVDAGGKVIKLTPSGATVASQQGYQPSCLKGGLYCLPRPLVPLPRAPAK